MNIKIISCLFLFLAIIFPSVGSSDQESFIFRPNIGYSSIDGDKFSLLSVRILSVLSQKRKVGLDFAYFKNKEEDKEENNFTVIGATWEEKFFGWFNCGFGPALYLNFGDQEKDEEEDTFGFISDLGWEPNNFYGGLNPFITYRNDFIFSDDNKMGHSIVVGLSFDL